MNFILASFTASFFLVLSILLLHIPRPPIRKHAQEQRADLVVKNGVVFTADSSLPLADSFAVSNGRILRIGNYSSIQSLVGDETKILDVERRVVLPGFIDSHVHFLSGGLEISRVNLHGIFDKSEFVRRIHEAARNLKVGAWLLGGGWSNDLWGGELPEASWIDDVTPDNPVWLSRVDRHMGLANSVALRLAGINSSSEDVKGGSIVKSSQGEPTGLLIDAAMNLLFSWITESSKDERRDALLKASNLALSEGVTTVVDFGRFFQGGPLQHPWDDFSDVYKWTDSWGGMRVRACLFFPMETWTRLYDVVTNTGRYISDFIFLGGVKAFFDGSLGSSSALFHESYVGELGNYGLQVIDSAVLLNMTCAADEAGLQVAVHAIGDKANDKILDMYESVISINGQKDRRFRVEHAQHLAPTTPERFGELGVVASMQPLHLLDDADPATKKLGFERAERGSYLFRSLQKHTRLALGSDWPVAEINPLKSIRTAMTRMLPRSKSVWAPDQRISLNDALIGHTISAAHACFLDHILGSLSPGKFADFVVLSATSLDEFYGDDAIAVEATYVGGKLAFFGK